MAIKNLITLVLVKRLHTSSSSPQQRGYRIKLRTMTYDSLLFNYISSSNQAEPTYVSSARRFLAPPPLPLSALVFVVVDCLLPFFVCLFSPARRGHGSSFSVQLASRASSSLQVQYFGPGPKVRAIYYGTVGTTHHAPSLLEMVLATFS